MGVKWPWVSRARLDYALALLVERRETSSMLHDEQTKHHINALDDKQKSIDSLHAIISAQATALIHNDGDKLRAARAMAAELEGGADPPSSFDATFAQEHDDYLSHNAGDPPLEGEDVSYFLPPADNTEDNLENGE